MLDDAEAGLAAARAREQRLRDAVTAMLGKYRKDFDPTKILSGAACVSVPVTIDQMRALRAALEKE